MHATTSYHRYASARHALAGAFVLCSLSVPGTPAVAATLTACVHNPTELRAALLAAQTNAGLNLVKVARGTYDNAGDSFGFNSATAGQLDIGGGYNDDCSTRIPNPALTIFNGSGATAVLSVTSSAGIQVRFLTIQNGTSPTVGAGLYANSANGDVTINYNIIRNNQGQASSGLEAIISGMNATGTLEVDGNLIYGNSATAINGGGFLQNAGLGNTYVTNNTVTGNSAVETFGASGLDLSPGSTQADVSNNIFWGNSGGDDLVVLNGGGGGVLLILNDYSTLGDTPPPVANGNVNVDPQFVSASDFHLAASSPLLALGATAPAGGLLSMDLDGNPRTYNAMTDTVDLGAYEHGDEIFSNGYDR